MIYIKYILCNIKKIMCTIITLFNRKETTVERQSRPKTKNFLKNMHRIRLIFME